MLARASSLPTPSPGPFALYAAAAHRYSRGDRAGLRAGRGRGPAPV